MTEIKVSRIGPEHIGKEAQLAPPNEPLWHRIVDIECGNVWTEYRGNYGSWKDSDFIAIRDPKPYSECDKQSCGCHPKEKELKPYSECCNPDCSCFICFQKLKKNEPMELKPSERITEIWSSLMPNHGCQPVCQLCVNTRFKAIEKFLDEQYLKEKK